MNTYCSSIQLNECLRGVLPWPRRVETSVRGLERFDLAQYNFEEPLLVHAEVHSLANAKSIDSLRMLALEHLLEDQPGRL